MAIIDMRETQKPQEKGLFIPEHKIKAVEEEMKAEIIAEIEESGQIITTQDEIDEALEAVVEEAIDTALEKVSELLGTDVENIEEGSIVVTDRQLEIAEEKLRESIVGQDEMVVSDEQLEMAEAKLTEMVRESVIAEAEEAVDNILESKIGMDFDTISDMDEALYVIEENQLETVENKLKESFMTDLAEAHKVDIEDIKEGRINILSDADFTKLEETFIAKIAESLDMSVESLSEKIHSEPKGETITEDVKESKTWEQEKDAAHTDGLFENLMNKTGMAEAVEAKEIPQDGGSSLAESLIDNAIGGDAKEEKISEKTLLNNLV